MGFLRARTPAIAAATAFVACGVFATAMTPPRGAREDVHARSLAATCTTCHVSGGAGLPAIPPLEGRRAADIADAMRAFAKGTRPGTVMPHIARGYRDEDIEAIAAWFAAQR
jgi:cytochrome subunit of sulfide dehydrogenase